MILIDTNYLVDFILPPHDEAAEARNAKTKILLAGIENGHLQAIFPEVVLHECFYVLVTRLDAIDVPTFCMLFDSILQYPGWQVTSENLEVYLAALELLELQPQIELSDALIAARAAFHGATLATFDKRLAKAYSGPIWNVDS